jgi:hypothetical protein
VEITGRLLTASNSTKVYIEPLQYEIKVVGTEAPAIARTDLGENTVGVRFEAFVEGMKLDKAAIEAAQMQYTLNKPYADSITLNITVADDGTITAAPVYEKGGWWAGYLVPVGMMEITATIFNASATGEAQITADFMNELIYNWVIPGLILLFLAGEIFKPRFKYRGRIHYIQGEGAGPMITAPATGWYATGLFCFRALLPFVRDAKNINGAKFYAKGILWNRSTIFIKTSHYPQYSGTMDGGLSEVESVRFGKREIDRFEEGDRTKKLAPGNALISCADQNYRSCQIYLYSDN